jgi:hypothetical protein
MINQIAASVVRVVAVAPAFAHGDADASPSPEPSTTNISVAATAAAVPAKIAAQETADVLASTVPSAADNDVSILLSSLIMRAHGKQQNDRNRHTQHPQKNSATHVIPLTLFRELMLRAAT